jgi:hypothetical protein
MKKKNFPTISTFSGPIFLSFLENRIFFKNQAFLHAAPMIFVILSSKATKKTYPTAVYRWGHLTKDFYFPSTVFLRVYDLFIYYMMFHVQTGCQPMLFVFI